MDKKLILNQTREILQDYEPDQCGRTAELLQALWLKTEPKKTAYLVKNDQQRKIVSVQLLKK
ncbi:MAG: hypothetical protein AB1414_20880 [bacterium]